MNKLLWEELDLDENFNYKNVDEAYKNIENKTPRTTYAWKVLRDKYYSEIYREYKNEDLLVRAGFVPDPFTLDEIDFYNINLLTTPFDKLKSNIDTIDNPIVLLSTGGFYPIHNGHIKMMEDARKVLTENGYDVVGGYLSLSHDDYISTKPYYISDQYERVNEDREYLKNNDWLMIDPWESIYVRTPINFTDVIERLEQYLQKYVSKKIKVAYVFGGDNVEFMYCFKKSGIAVCLNRNGYNDLFESTKEIKNENMYFIENTEDTSLLSSRNIREKQLKNEVSYKDVGNYLIRNESLLPLENLVRDNNVELLKQLQEEFLNKFMRVLSNCFDNKIFIKVINMEFQLKDAYNYLQEQKTINLDSYFRGTYNLEVSRLFNISSYQDKYIELIGRLGYESIEEQVNKIDKGNYILVDDDSVTGRTLKSIKEMLPSKVKIEQTYLLANSINEKVFDVVDLRDFIVGTKNSGLVVKLPNGKYTRAPYMMPYVNLTTRASIPPSKEREFSILVWQMNKDFYEKYNKNFQLKDADSNFITLMKYVGFNDNDLLVDICDWHIKKLSNDRFKIVPYSDDLRTQIIEFLKSVAIDEFGFKEWKNYLENKSFEPYKTDYSKFMIVFDNDDNIIATIGGLQVDNETIKLNSFYVKKDYRYHKIGTNLYNELIKYSKKMNYKYMILCTYDKYDIATKFYQKRGFRIYKNDEFERWYKKEL